MNRTLCSLLIASAAALLAPVPAMGQYINAHAGKAEAQQQNPWLGGQRSDLKFEITKVEWKKDPCVSDPSVFILKGAIVEIEIDWVKAMLAGSMVGQAESPSRLADDDFFTVQWDRKGGRWTLASMTANGTDAIGGANPPAAPGGNGTWDGYKIKPPAGFEEGKVRPVKYVLCFTYTPLGPGDQCWVAPLALRGWYVHTYDGDTHVFATPGMSISPGFPWASVAVDVSFANDHAWQKQLVNDGINHVRQYDPAPCVPFEICCPTGGSVTRPAPTGTLTPSNPVIPRNNPVGAGVTGQNFGAVQFTAYTPSGDILGAELVTTPPACAPCNADFDFDIPFNYEGTLLIIEAALLNLDGPATVLTTEVAVPDPLPTPALGSAILGPSDRVVHNDILTIQIEDTSPGLTEFDVSAALSIRAERVLDGSSSLADLEQNPPVALVGPGLFEAQLSVSIDAPPNLPDGVLAFGPAELIRVVYDNADDEPGTSLLVGLPNERSVNPWAPSQPESSGVRFEGFGQGTGRIEFLIEEPAGFTPVFVEPLPGEPGPATAARLADDITSGLFGIPGLTGTVSPNGALVLGGYDQGNLHQWTDPGINLVAVCRTDLNGDGVVDNGDIGIFISLFLAQDPAVDFNSDGVIDNGDIGGFITAFLAGC